GHEQHRGQSETVKQRQDAKEPMLPREPARLDRGLDIRTQVLVSLAYALGMTGGSTRVKQDGRVVRVHFGSGGDGSEIAEYDVALERQVLDEDHLDARGGGLIREMADREDDVDLGVLHDAREFVRLQQKIKR